MKIIVHPPHEFPKVVSEGIPLSPGYHHFLSVSPESVSKEETHLLGPLQGIYATKGGGGLPCVPCTVVKWEYVHAVKPE